MVTNASFFHPVEVIWVKNFLDRDPWTSFIALKGSPDPNQFIFEINVAKSRIKGGGTSRAKRRQVNLIMTSLRIEFSRPENPKIHKNFLVRTISGDDVIVSDKTSKASTAVW